MGTSRPDALAALLERAVQRHRAGDLEQVAAGYPHLVLLAPAHPDALFCWA